MHCCLILSRMRIFVQNFIVILPIFLIGIQLRMWNMMTSQEVLKLCCNLVTDIDVLLVKLRDMERLSNFLFACGWGLLTASLFMPLDFVPRKISLLKILLRLLFKFWTEIWFMIADNTYCVSHRITVHGRHLLRYHLISHKTKGRKLLKILLKYLLCFYEWFGCDCFC